MFKSEFRILSVATLCLIVGIIISYYNTSSFGYDDANIISFDKEQVNIFDFTIRYADVREKYRYLDSIIPDEIIII